MRTSAFFLSLVLTLTFIYTSYSQTSHTVSEAQKLFQSGHRKLYDADFNGAVKDLTKAIKLNVSNGVLEKIDTLEFRNEIAYSIRALAKIQLKEYQSAIADCNMSMKTDRGYSYAYYVRGLAKKALTDFKGSLDDFSKTIELAPINNRAYYDRGLVKQSLKDYKEAIKDYDEAIKLANKMGVAYYQRGRAKNELGDKAGASEDMDMAAKYGVKEAQNPLKDIHNIIRNYNSK